MELTAAAWNSMTWPGPCSASTFVAGLTVRASAWVVLVGKATIAVCVEVLSADNLFRIKALDIDKDVDLKPPLMFSLWKKCCDHKTIVLFKVTNAEGEQAFVANSPLLKLSAC